MTLTESQPQLGGMGRLHTITQELRVTQWYTWLYEKELPTWHHLRRDRWL